jgi:hypothetical protein
MRAERIVLIVAAAFFFTIGLASGQAAQPATQPATQFTKSAGILEAVDGLTLTLSAGAKHGQAQDETVPGKTVVTIPDDGEIYCDGAKTGIDQLKVGMEVTIVSLPAAATHPARTLVIANFESVDGKVVSVDGNKVIVQQKQDGGDFKDVVVATDAKTRFQLAGFMIAGGHYGQKDATIDQLKPGVVVKAVPAGEVAKIIYIEQPADGPSTQPSN